LTPDAGHEKAAAPGRKGRAAAEFGESSFGVVRYYTGAMVRRASDAGKEGAMIKATFDKDGRTVLLLGLSFKNLDKFRAEAGDTFIRIDGREMDLPIDVMIISGETEAHMQELLEGGIGPHTKGTFDPKLRS
jgi:hypothetical protein